MNESAERVLRIAGLKARVGDTDILHGIDLEIRPGEVHAVMGPNGSGKSTLSHVLMGRPGYEVTGGSVTLDGVDLLALPTWQRARAGLFLALQHPTEVPGVSLESVVAEATRTDGRAAEGIHDALVAEAARIGFDERFVSRPMNVDLSGGEKKRNEMLMLGALQPHYAVLDEIDSGLDVDALAACPEGSRRPPRRTASECWPSPTSAACWRCWSLIGYMCWPPGASRPPEDRKWLSAWRPKVTPGSWLKQEPQWGCPRA